MKRSEKGFVRLVLFLVLWVALVTVGVALVLRVSGVSTQELRGLLALPRPVAGLLAILCGGLYASDVYRYRVLGAAIGTPVGYRAALDASVANFFFSWTTPGTALGAPAAIVMLARRGVPWDAASLIAFGKSVTGTAFVLLAAFVMLATGLGPGFGSEVRWVLTVGTVLVALTLATPLAGAFFPRRSQALIDRLELRFGKRPNSRLSRVISAVAQGLRGAVERLTQLRVGGVTVLARLAISHLIYFTIFVSIAVVLTAALGANSWPLAAGISTVFVAFSYVAPTPGGAGLSEATAVLFYGSLLPAAQAVAAVLLFRALTFYLQVAVGIIYLPLAGGLAEILSRPRRRET